jgi:hypothetical protein
MAQTLTQPTLDYKLTAEAILDSLRNERDRQIVSQRFSLGADKRETLERIGSRFGITRERVRQIEKTATARLKQQPTPELKQIDELLRHHLEEQGNVRLLEEVATAIGASTPAERTYVSFLATLAPSIEVVEDSDHYHPTLVVAPIHTKAELTAITQRLVDALQAHGRPMPVDTLHASTAPELPRETVENLAQASKRLAKLDGHWGLSHWPAVNPRSIRDKTYLVLHKHGQPLHFTEIAERITGLGQRKRDVTVQAVHNELIKDSRFVLVGRGIYALAEWGYTPGTVADIITEILREESPLHKDEIVKRVLQKRQVKTTTIVLNLQEKNQFVRVSKATYALR